MDIAISFFIDNSGVCLTSKFFWTGLIIGFILAFGVYWVVDKLGTKRESIPEHEAAFNIAGCRNEISNVEYLLMRNDIEKARSTIFHARNISDQYLRFVIPDRKRRKIMRFLRQADKDITGNAREPALLSVQSALVILEDC